MSNIPERMKAVIAYAPGDYRYKEVETPRAGEDDIIIKVEGCGVCGSDLKCYTGAPIFWGGDGNAAFVKAPVIPGHEFYGTVVEVGVNVYIGGDFKIGDKVISEMIVPCGECRFCKEGQYWMCQISDGYGFQSHVNGAFAEYMRFPKKSRVFKLPQDMPFEKAVLIEPFSCAMHAVERGSITKRDVVVISGLGPLGLGMVGAAKTFNPAKLIGLDVKQNRLDLAKKFGCDVVLNPKEVDVVNEIRKMTDGYGCDVYIEAAAHPSSVVQGLQAIRKLGRFVEFSVFGEPVTCDWSIISDRKELDVLGAHLAPNCYPKVIKALSEGTLPTEGVVTHKFHLSEFEKAFEVAHKADNSIKVALVP